MVDFANKWFRNRDANQDASDDLWSVDSIDRVVGDRQPRPRTEGFDDEPSIAPGKQLVSEQDPFDGSAVRSPGKQTAVGLDASRYPSQRPLAESTTRKDAAITGPHPTLPHASTIQRFFGHHDISGIVVHADRTASDSADEMGATAYTSGRNVVLGGGTDLFTVAHEAAHYIEQAHGRVSLSSGIGEAGDIYEQHADKVAALVVAGQSAEALLDEYIGHSMGTVRDQAPATGPIQRKESELAIAAKAKVPSKLQSAREFEKKLGIAAYGHPSAEQAATAVVDKMVTAVIPGFDETNPADQQRYSDLFGKDNLGATDTSRANGAWSAGQVGKDFDTLREAMQRGNLREKMTGIYNASLGGFKQEVLALMQEDQTTIRNRGLDPVKLNRRSNQMKFNPAAKDLYRDPGNPLDRKKLSSYEHTGQTRTAAVGDDQKSTRTVGELDDDDIGLSVRETAFMFGTGTVDDSRIVQWKEGGTFWNVNPDNKWVKKYQEKLLMPVVAGPSGTALRLFQAWEYLNKPTSNVDFRLALLGWMLTGNDHSFHEIMATSAEYGLPYTPGPDAYRSIAPFSLQELRDIAEPEGLPDEENYRTDHVTSTDPAHDLRIMGGAQTSILTTPAQVEGFNWLITSGGAFPGVDGGGLAQAMAILVYTDDRNSGPQGVSAFEFINNVLKGNTNRLAMYYFIRKDPKLKAAYASNKFNIQELVAEAKEHAKQAQQGLELLPVFSGDVFRGYKSNSLPTAGSVWTEQKFLSMSKNRAVAEGFALNATTKGRYKILVTMVSVTGREIGQVSMMGPGEEEVLFAASSQFTVISAPTPWAGVDGGYEVRWQEV